MKNIIRKEYLNKRNHIINREEKSAVITQKIKENLKYQESKVIAIYKSFSSEVDTKEIIDYSYQCGKTVCFPRVEGEELFFYQTDKDDLFEKSSYGIDEPIKNISRRIVPDFVIVPGVVFDEKGGRMGYGKGYYDRYFQNYSVYKVGVCFREQLIESVPMNYHDIYMDFVIHD